MSGGVQITDDAASKFLTGSKTVGTAAVQLTATGTPLTRGVSIRAASSNAGKIYIGPASTVTALSAAGTDGQELAAGERQFVPIDDLSKVFLISDTAGQKITFLAA